MFTKKSVIEDYKSGMTIAEIAKKYHVILYAVSSLIKQENLPTSRIIKKILNDLDFQNYFKTVYTEHDKMKDICNILI